MTYTSEDEEFDLTCKCGPNHDECFVECQCECHDTDADRVSS